MTHKSVPQDIGERALAPLWLLLFAGHWVGLTLLNEFGFLRREQIADWNDALFSKLYLLLLIFTLLHLALRALRRENLPPKEDDTASQRKI